MADSEHGQAYAVGFNLPYAAILELLIRCGVSCSAFAQREDEDSVDIMWVLCDPSAGNVGLLEKALSAMAGKPLHIITHQGPVYPRHRKAFVAQCYIHLPENCSVQSIPRREFHSDDLSIIRRRLGITDHVEDFIMRRWDSMRELIPTPGEPGPSSELGGTSRDGDPLALPPEILDQVFAQLSVPQLRSAIPLWWISFERKVINSIMDLNSAGGVCRSWLALSRKYVLNNVPLYISRRTATAFLMLLRNQEWCKEIKNLYISFPFKAENLSLAESIEFVAAILDLLPDLQGLHFDNMDASRISARFMSNLRMPNELDVFGFRVIGFGLGGFINDVPQSHIPHARIRLPVFSKLRSLCLAGVYMDNWQGNPAFQRLQELYLHWTLPVGGSYRTLLAFLSGLSLVRLGLQHVVVSSQDIADFTRQTRTVQSFSFYDLAEPPGRHPWTFESIHILQGAFSGQIDPDWAFPYRFVSRC